MKNNILILVFAMLSFVLFNRITSNLLAIHSQTTTEYVVDAKAQIENICAEDELMYLKINSL